MAINQALVTIIDVAIQERVDAVFCAGDLYEHEVAGPDEGDHLRSQFARLGQVPVLVAPGNHDPLVNDSLYRRVNWSSNVHVFQSGRLEKVEPAPGLAVWGAAHLSTSGTPSFLAGFRAGRDGVQIALFHGAETAFHPAADYSAQAGHAPFRQEEVAACGLRHAFVGHYHRARLAADHTFPGSPEPLRFGEGDGGVVIAEIDSVGVVRREFRRIGCYRLHDLELDVTGAGGAIEVALMAERLLEGRRGSARIRLRGRPAPGTTISLELMPRGGEGLDVTYAMDGLVPTYDLDSLSREPTVRGEFVRGVLAAGLDPDRRDRVIEVGLRALEGREDLDPLR